MSTPLRVPPSKLPEVGTTIFSRMSQLAAQHGAINLGQGFPDFDCSPELQRYLAEAVAEGHNQYAPMPGLPALRAAVAAKNRATQGFAHDPESEITITAGATQAIASTLMALVQPGDEVIVLEPAYDSYAPAIALAGARAVGVALAADAGYAPDWAQVRAAVTPRTRALMLNFPHNPTGRCLREDDLRALEALVEDTGILLISDEVYEHIVFDGQPHLSVMRSPRLARAAVVISSFGKTLHTTGWKIGTVCAPAALSAEFRKVHQFTAFAVNTPGQHAVARMLERHPEAWRDLPAFYQAKRDRFVAGLARTPLRALPCEGTYFVLVDYSAVSDEPEEAFACRLITEAGVAAIPVSVFYRQPQERRTVRLCFAKREDTLAEALRRLERLAPG
jgi:methionine aminotransferase